LVSEFDLIISYQVKKILLNSLNGKFSEKSKSFSFTVTKNMNYCILNPVEELKTKIKIQEIACDLYFNFIFLVWYIINLNLFPK
jgi:hypothetical protein